MLAPHVLGKLFSRRKTTPDAPSPRTALSVVERVARVLGVVAVVWFALAAGWGMFGVIGGGHYGSAIGAGISGENMIKWKIIAPVYDYVQGEPQPALYFCHHPFGVEWLIVPFLVVFGHHEWVIYFPAVLMSLGTVWLLYDFGKRAWGPVGGAACAVGYSIVPITLSFSNYLNLEVMVLFGWALFFWGHFRMIETSKKRYLWWSVLGAFVAINGDWVGFIAVGLVLGWGTLRAFVLPKRVVPPVRFELYARWWVITATVTVAVGLFYVFLLFHWDKMVDLLQNAKYRGGGEGMTLEQILLPRKHRIELMFTPPIIFLGKIAVPLLVVRFLVRRREEELYSLAVLVAAVIQYVGFKNGADIHVFWPHHFGLYFALAFAEIAVTLKWLFEKGFSLIPKLDAKAAATVSTLAFTIAFVAVVLPDSLRVLREGRETWGRFNQEMMRPEFDEVLALRTVAPRMPEGTILDAHGSQWWGWQSSWALHAPHRDMPGLPQRGDADVAPFWLGRLSRLTAPEIQRIASEFFVELYGDMIVIDKRAPQKPLDAFVFAEREPNPIEWYFIGGNEPIHTIARDDYATYEWRTALGQRAEVPREAPVTLDQRRIAHNIAVEQGDDARAAALATEIEASLERAPIARFNDGTRLIGIRKIGGTSPRIETWFEAPGPNEGEVDWGVRAVMLGKVAWSFIPSDTLDRDVGSLMSMSTRLWKKGCFYTSTATLYRRVGVEKFYGAFFSRSGGHAPALVGRPDNRLDLAVYE